MAPSYRCVPCDRQFQTERGLAIHSCKAHGECHDRAEDRHQSPQLHLRLGAALHASATREARRRGLTLPDLVRAELQRVAGP